MRDLPPARRTIRTGGVMLAMDIDKFGSPTNRAWVALALIFSFASAGLTRLSPASNNPSP